MKKLLLFSIALFISFGIMAQGKLAPKKSNKMVNSTEKIDAPINPVQPTPVVSTKFDFKGTAEVERVYIGKSANIYSVLLEEQRGADYNAEIGLHSFTFRTDPATYPEAATSGSIITATSADGGSTWNDTWMLNTGDLGRYPSGVIYNPDGNSDPNEAYAIAVGPVTSGAGWLSNFFASSKINGDNLDNQLFDADPAYSGSQLVRNGLQVCTDGFAHIVNSKYQDNGSGYSLEMNLNAWFAEFNGSGFDWDYVDVPVDLALRSDGTTKNFWTFGNAWSNDGSIGYAWLIGQTADLEDESGYQPVIFYSTDQGESWDPIEILLEDNETMSEYLWASEQFTGPMWPLCTELDGVVDQNNNLQMFVKATGTYSTHPDSIGYSYTGNKDYIFNLEISQDGVQDVMAVDSILAADVTASTDWSLGAEGWGTRMRASRSYDGQSIFVVWTDTEDPDSYDGENGAPNIKAAGRLVNGDFTAYPVTNFTADDLYAGYYFFINVGQICSEEGGYLHIPVTTTVTPQEISGGNELTPVTHSYVKGIKFLKTVGLEEGIESGANTISVSQNQPNPFTGTTNIEVTSNTVAPVSIEVSNIMGQTVYTQNAGTINGTMKVQMNANDLESGVYFYTVRIGAESVSKKMIIE